MKDFISLFDLRAVGTIQQDIRNNMLLGTFIGKPKRNAWPRVFGGLLLAQAYVAAAQTVPKDKYLHSLHSYFLLPASLEEEIEYKVFLLRDGRSFVTRQVQAYQKGVCIFTLSCSFQNLEKGFSFQENLQKAGQLIKEQQYDILTLLKDYPYSSEEAEKITLMKNYWHLQKPFLFYPHCLKNYIQRQEDLSLKRYHIFRLSEKMIQDPILCQAFLIYLSDMAILDNSLYHQKDSIFTGHIQSGSLDHSFWVHKNPDPLDWAEGIIYALESPFIGNNRGFNKGTLYSANGRMLASVAQEGLLRVKQNFNK